jgi:hypothetical protein
MKSYISATVFLAILACAGSAQAAKQDETEGMAGMSGQSREIYQKTDKKAAQRPGQTVVKPAIEPAKGPKGESKATKGEETAGTAPANGTKAK